MTYKALTFGLGFLAFSLSQPITAQEMKQETKVENTLLLRFAANNDAFDQRITDTAKDFFRRQITTCQATPDRAVRQLPTGYGNIVFPAAEASFPSPVSGLWAEHVKIRACNQIWQINLLAIGRSKDIPLILALIPGDTKADPASQRSAERLGATAIKKADESCADNPSAQNTKILGYKQVDGTVGKTDAQQGWFEQWDYMFCQKMIPVQLAFTPDGSGSYDIKARVANATPTPAPVSKPDPAAVVAPTQAPAGNAATPPAN